MRIFGFNSYALLAPQAVMGIVSAGLMYDLVRRRFGRVAGFGGGGRPGDHADDRRR